MHAHLHPLVRLTTQQLLTSRPVSMYMFVVQSLVVTSPSAYEAAQDAHAIAILTEWDEFKQLDYEKIYSIMAKPVSTHSPCLHTLGSNHSRGAV